MVFAKFQTLLSSRLNTLDSTSSSCWNSSPGKRRGAADYPVTNLGENPVDVYMYSAVGGSAIGTQYIPELISAYAAANGYIVKKSVGRDTRDLTFSLTDTSGKTVGRQHVGKPTVGFTRRDGEQPSRIL